jgi:hypothetical protein
MMTPLSRRLTLIASLIVAASRGTFAAVTKATLTASPTSFAGDCPKKIVFAGSITVDAPATVTYVFTRSDGAKDTITKTLKFRAAGTKSVTEDTWTLGDTFNGWEAIKVTAPNAIESTHATFKLACNPALNSVKAAHGNTDWHIDTANEFLTGKNMAGTSTAANFAPGSWTKTHIHTGLTNTAHFYDDKTMTATADDSNGTNGIDKPMLFFYASHGNATGWNTLGNSGHQTDMLLGNPAGFGQLRYYWQCSCEVFAHGPRVCPAGSDDCDYSDPDGFDGSSDSVDMRNIFQRWGPVIGPDLRMACGMSTLAYCHTYEVNEVWNAYNNKGLGVVDSFIDGFEDNGAVVPICIARGGPDIGSTPLYDDEFTNQRNTQPSSHLHIVYPGGTQSDPPVIKWTQILIPKAVKLIFVEPAPDPENFRGKLFTERNVEMFRDTQFAGGAATVRRNKESGAVYLKAVSPSREVRAGSSSTGETQRRAVDVARRLGWLGDEEVRVSVKPLRTASMDTKSRKVTRGEKGTLVTISRRIRNGDQLLDVLGPGGRIDIELAPGGEVLRAGRTWRKARGQDQEVPVKPFELALQDAQRRLKNAEAYKLGDWRFGYKEQAGNAEQRVLGVIYQFDFVPRDRERMIEFPPQRIEVAGMER